MTYTAEWYRDGSGARIVDDSGQYITDLRLEDWYENGATEPRRAWVTTVYDLDGPEAPMAYSKMVRLDGEPLTSEADMLALTEAALEALATGPPATPLPVTPSPHAAGSPEAQYELVCLIHSGWGAAHARVQQQAHRKDEPGGGLLMVAVTEMLAWTRLMDEVFDQVWRSGPEERRELASQHADTRIARLLEAEDRDFHFADAYRERQGNGEPYKDWSVAFFKGNVIREELQATRWLAGKLLHFGPRPAVELRQWRAGVEPRWKWRSADAIMPDVPRQDDERRGQRDAYERYLAGRDVVGSLNYVGEMIEAEYFFYRLLLKSDPN